MIDSQNNGDSWKPDEKAVLMFEMWFHISYHMSQRANLIYLIPDCFCIFFLICLSWQSVRLESKEDQNVQMCQIAIGQRAITALRWYPMWSNQSRWNTQRATYVNEWRCSELIESWVMTQQSVEHLGESVHNGRELVLLCLAITSLHRRMSNINRLKLRTQRTVKFDQIESRS